MTELAKTSILAVIFLGLVMLYALVTASTVADFGRGHRK